MREWGQVLPALTWGAGVPKSRTLTRMVCIREIQSACSSQSPPADDVPTRKAAPVTRYPPPSDMTRGSWRRKCRVVWIYPGAGRSRRKLIPAAPYPPRHRIRTCTVGLVARRRRRSAVGRHPRPHALRLVRLLRNRPRRAPMRRHGAGHSPHRRRRSPRPVCRSSPMRDSCLALHRRAPAAIRGGCDR